MTYAPVGVHDQAHGFLLRPHAPLEKAGMT
jgi:hypothetical protein